MNGVKNRDLFTIVEFGTSKVCVLHGGRDKGGNPTVFGWGSRDSAGAIIKGEVVNLPAASKALAGALEDADSSAGGLYDRDQVYFLVSGRGISARQGEGNVMIYDSDRRITSAHISEAEEKASSISLAPDQCHLVSFTSYFMLDMNTRVKDPCGHCANRLDAFIHIILADRAKVDTMRNMIREFGFEQEIQPVFSGIASAYGTLTHDEKEQGTLLIDIGAGVCDYILVHDDGVLMSGVLPIGMDNLINDLAVGLELSQEQARKFLLEGRFEQLKRSGEAFLPLPVSSELHRNIPVGSYEKIVELRLNELFSILKEEIDSRKLSSYLKSGIVVTGGGSLFPMVLECARNTFRTHIRQGEPLEISGAVTGLDNPRYSALLGALNYSLQTDEAQNGLKGIEKVADALEGIGGIFNKLKDVTKAFKL